MLIRWTHASFYGECYLLTYVHTGAPLSSCYWQSLGYLQVSLHSRSSKPTLDIQHGTLCLYQAKPCCQLFFFTLRTLRTLTWIPFAFWLWGSSHSYLRLGGSVRRIGLSIPMPYLRRVCFYVCLLKKTVSPSLLFANQTCQSGSGSFPFSFCVSPWLLLKQTISISFGRAGLYTFKNRGDQN